MQQANDTQTHQLDSYTTLTIKPDGTAILNIRKDYGMFNTTKTVNMCGSIAVNGTLSISSPENIVERPLSEGEITTLAAEVPTNLMGRMNDMRSRNAAIHAA